MPSPLHDLADRLGIIDEYVDQTGKERRHTSDDTRVALLAVMGFPADTDAEARESLDRLFEEDRASILPPAVVIRHGEARPRSLIGIETIGTDVSWAVTVRDEHGTDRSGAGLAAAGGFSESTAVAYPPDLPPGYYDVTVRIDAPNATFDAHQLLVVAPPRCPSPADLLGGGVFGLIANLYTLRSETNAGIGNLGDLRALAEWGAEIGASFVGVNPLHALFNRGVHISPYSPVSRLFRNPLYLDVAALPEVAASGEARALLDAPAARSAFDELRASDRVDYERIATTLDPVLRAAFRSFREWSGTAATDRAACFERFIADGGERLRDFATFMALDRHHATARRGGKGRNGGVPWSEWPGRLRDPRSAAVRQFARDHADEIAYHQWVQFALDEQLGDAQRAARHAGMRIGLYQDLAIGTSPHGADTWANPELFLAGVSIGAPPDPYSATGQNWDLAPIDPRRLARQGYAYWIDLVRNSLRHAGALRLDHVMGLFQQFWIPEGESGAKGAYVRFPADDLLGILSLEATRANALVVGEDLGTVPPQVPPALQDRTILSSKVLYFERTRTGGFNAAAKYPSLALATANTHDMPTLAGWWEGRDIELRNATGLLGKKGKDDATVKNARAERTKEKRLLVRRLADDGALASARTPGSDADLLGAVHRFLCMTPSALVGLSLDDLAGERDPVNLPGVGPDVYPSWTRRMSVAIEDLRRDAHVHRALGCETRRR